MILSEVTMPGRLVLFALALAFAGLVVASCGGGATPGADAGSDSPGADVGQSSGNDGGGTTPGPDAGTVARVDASVAGPDAGTVARVDASVAGPDAGGSSTRPGLEGFCDHYKECGGSYYGTAQDCIDATVGYWGDCRRPQLDAFGECMKAVPCSEWNPDAYNPSSTPCAAEWATMTGTSC
jgi:hypothetical protein